MTGILETDADHLAAADPQLAAARAMTPELPVVSRPGGFATMLHMILEQQVSIDAAAAMFRRLSDTLGSVTPNAFLTLDRETLARCGFSRQKAGYATGLAEAILDGSFSFEGLADLDDAEAVATLTALRGIGPWTAECYLLFTQQRRDILPSGDLALRVSWGELTEAPSPPTDDELNATAQAWRPRRSAAAYLLWGAYLARRGRT